MKRLIKGISAACVLGIALVGCTPANTQQNSYRAVSEAKVDLLAEVEASAAKLMARTPDQAKLGTVMSASFVDIDNLRNSSTFGRIVSEHYASALARSGYNLIEVKMRDSLFIKEQAGEFMLSRQLQSLSSSHDAQGILIGTYAVGGERVYVSVRLVRSEDNMIIASDDFSVPLNRDVKAMLPRRR